MNPLRRAVARIACSQYTRNRVVLQPLAQSYSTKQSSKVKKYGTAKTAAEATVSKEVEWPRPSEIPFQVKVANSVTLVGSIDMPVQSQASPDGKYWAGTIISGEASSDSPPFWIPVIFEGDLAHIAAFHLKKNDHVHISGQLTADKPPINAIEGHANVQVMVHSINFVEQASETRNVVASETRNVAASETRNVAASETRNVAASHEQKGATVNNLASLRQDGDFTSNPWRDLIDNPKDWQDYRTKKRSGLVNPRYPDFKCKNGGSSLWLNKAPRWVLSELEGVEFDVQTSKSKYGKQHKGEESWKDLVENPGKWWDNRLNKRKERAPDFKHKETGEALWLSDSPAWVLPKLPPSKDEKNAAFSKRQTLLS